MSPVVNLTCVRVLRFPRVSGDEPAKRLTHDGNQEFSPRERG